VRQQIEIWRKELINLARSNRLLYFRHTKSSTLEIVREPDRVGEVVSRLIAGHAWRFFMPSDPSGDAEDGDPTGASDQGQNFVGELLDVPSPDELITTKADSKSLRNALRLLDRRATQEFMDKGIWILYLAAGVLRWREPDADDEAESPLLLVPVELYRESAHAPYELRRVEEDAVINPALSLRLADFGLELPTIEDEFDLDEVLAAIEDLIEGREHWEVQRRLLISPFSFHKEVMYRDLLQNAGTIAQDPAVRALALGSDESLGLDFDPIPGDRLDADAPPEEVMTILDADATQRQCIAAAAAGRSFVMDGPPGTGKSQTIANMVAELLAAGRTVLFVSEKAAALEVVQKRLRHAGLGDYTLELHSHKATRKEVAQQLGAALHYHPAAPAPMSETSMSQLRQRRHELSERARAVNEIRRPLGRTVHQVIGRIAELQVLPQAPPPRVDSGLGADALAQILAVAGELARAWGPVTRGDEFLWRGIRDAQLDASRGQRTAEEIAETIACLHRVRLAAADIAEALLQSTPRTFEEAERLLALAVHIEGRREGPREWLITESLAPVERLSAVKAEQSSIRAARAQLLQEAIGSGWQELDPATGRALASARERLSSLAVRCELPPEFRASELQELSKFVGSSASVLADASGDARSIAAAFGLPTAGITLPRGIELAELGESAAAAARPDPAWLNPARIDDVDRAIQTLKTLCQACTQQRGELGAVFTEQVLDLDLETLCHRFTSVHTGLSKLGSAYRQDKRLVAGATRAGKASKDAIGMLPRALEWQTLTRHLHAAEREHAAVLGEHYYQRTDTDFEQLEQAAASARRALELAGRHPDTDALIRQVARGGSPDPDLVPAARRLSQSLSSWIESARTRFAEFSDRVSQTDLETAAQASTEMATVLEHGAAVIAPVLRVASPGVTLRAVQEILAARAEIAQLDDATARTFANDQSILGQRYTGLDTDWPQLTASLEWAGGLREINGGPLTSLAAERTQTADVRSADLDQALIGWFAARDHVLAYFTEGRASVLRAELDSHFSDVTELLEALKETVGDIEEWLEYCRARERLAELGVSDVASFCETHRIPAEHLTDVVERACLEGWLDDVLRTDSVRLGQVRADQLNPIVDQFRELDSELIRRTAGRVIEACNRRRPRTTVGAAGVIQREAQKQRKHMPVRRLLEEAGEVAQALKPCFMMSPLTVSQFLPPSLRFDAVVFDEASQVRPSDAINCIYRGAQLIVAGDDKQLPPTSFFEAVSMDGDEEWEDDQFEQYESILKQCKAGGLRELSLRWHYRSQHEDLIAYSNEAFYQGRLVTFPGAVHESDELGVKLIPVPNGIYRRGTARDNPREAEAVADRVMHWARASAHDPQTEVTVGVVAFSEAQAAAIEIALDRRREAEPELDEFFAEDRLDGFFVKNLENVQGDERDVMIFSVGYGRDENGKLTMNFGPLNRQGGQRRLNVAITRARQRVEVVSSITGTELEFNADLREGVRHLRRYLDYAARGAVALAIELDESGLDADSPFEEEVLRTIRAWGYDAVPQVGTAGYRVDIGVKHPAQTGRYALGIECDGWMYHSSKVARDRDRLRQEVLERLGWTIYRIWGTAWYRNRGEQEQRLRAAIAAAIQEDRPAGHHRMSAAHHGETAPELEPVTLDQPPAWTVPYRVAHMDMRTNRLPELHQPEAQPLLRDVIEHIVTVEGPALDTLVLRRVREIWNVGRAGTRIREAFERNVRALARLGVVTQDRHGFIALTGASIETVRVPGENPQARRSAEEIPLEETQLAVLQLVRDARRVKRSELTFEVARLFGWSRRGPDIAAALDRAVDALLRAGDLEADHDYLLG
jgi:very-short-patch-repair endonuclease